MSAFLSHFEKPAVTRQLKASIDDYRAQDVPAGSSQTIATYYLRINLS